MSAPLFRANGWSGPGCPGYRIGRFGAEKKNRAARLRGGGLQGLARAATADRRLQWAGEHRWRVGFDRQWPLLRRKLSRLSDRRFAGWLAGGINLSARRLGGFGPVRLGIAYRPI